MAETGGGERVLPPSPRRREQFRERGEVPRSREIPTLAVLLAAGVALGVLGPAAGGELLAHTSRLLQRLGTPDLAREDLPLLARDGMLTLAVAVLPLLALFAAVTLASSLAQTGLHFSVRPLLPNLQKVNPLGRFQQMFLSAQPLVEGGKAVFKLGVVGLGIYLILRPGLSRAPTLVGTETVRQAGLVLEGTGGMMLRIGLLFLALALLDYLWQRHTLEQRMMMTHSEAQQESKESDGDPQLRMRRKQVARELLLNRMMAEVPRADVVVTNPDHFAVALRYRQGEDDAPRVVAKGKNHKALRIKELAFRHGIPLVENRPLAQALYKQVKVGRAVPVALYRAVADVLAFIYRRRAEQEQRRGGRRGATAGGSPRPGAPRGRGGR